MRSTEAQFSQSELAGPYAVESNGSNDTCNPNSSGPANTPRNYVARHYSEHHPSGCREVGNALQILKKVPTLPQKKNKEKEMTLPAARRAHARRALPAASARAPMNAPLPRWPSPISSRSTLATHLSMRYGQLTKQYTPLDLLSVVCLLGMNAMPCLTAS